MSIAIGKAFEILLPEVTDKENEIITLTLMVDDELNAPWIVLSDDHLSLQSSSEYPTWESLEGDHLITILSQGGTNPTSTPLTFTITLTGLKTV